MIDIFKQAAECLYRFKNRQGGLKTLCLSQRSNPGAVYALCEKIVANYDVLTKFIEPRCQYKNTEQYFHTLVLVFERRTNGFPDKRRRMSRETRNTISLIKTLFTEPDMVQLQLSCEVQPIQLKTFRIAPGCYETVIAKLTELKVEPQKTQFANIVRIPPVPFNSLAGLGHFQSLASCLPVLAIQSVQNKTDKTVQVTGQIRPKLLDLCAAPGSKSLQAAELFEVTANELDHKRFQILQKRCQPQIKCINDDAFRVLDRLAVHEFDILLLDPTCSSSGTLNKDQAAATAMGGGAKEKDLKELAEFQLRLLSKTLETGVKIGAKTVSYSTCSINQEENEDVVRQALNATKQYKLVHALPEWEQRSSIYCECIKSSGDGEGFFVAVFQLV